MAYGIHPYLFSEDPWTKTTNINFINGIYRQKYEIAKRLDIKNVFEIGCRAGYMASVFLYAKKSYIGIDNNGDKSGGWNGSFPFAQRYVPQWAEQNGCKGKVILWDTQQSQSLPCGPVDCVYVDGDHDYRACLHDLNLAAKIAKLIWIDDTSFVPSVYEAVGYFISLNRQRIHNVQFLNTIRGDCLIYLDRNVQWSSGGDSGDFIAQLATLKHYGDVHINLVNRKVREPFTEDKTNKLFRRFLERQSYIKSLAFGENENAIDLDLWRGFCNGKRSIVDEVAQLFNADIKIPWLECDQPRAVAKVIVARSERYHEWDDDVWRRIIRKYGKEALFVGLEHEWREFNRIAPIQWYPTGDFWELAQGIAGSKLCIMNQSAPCWLAIGLGKQVIQETFRQVPNCKVGQGIFCDDTNGIMNNKLLDLPDV